MTSTPAGAALRLALATLVLALLLVGAVSGTLVRHLIQVAPAAALLAAASASRPWTSAAAMALFAFWLFIMSLIWAFLLGLANVITGTFSPTEIALTVVIGFAALAGLVAAWRTRPQPAWPARVAAFAVAAALQIGAMWLSLRPSFATR